MSDPLSALERHTLYAGLEREARSRISWRGPLVRVLNWTFDRQRLVITHAFMESYEVDVEQMSTSAEMLDWIFQLQGKTWVTEKDMGALIFMLRHIVHPQEHLCSGGVEKGPAAILENADHMLDRKAVPDFTQRRALRMAEEASMEDPDE